jgi:hypothetical protein
VDAIDEREARTRNSFLRAINQLVNEYRNTCGQDCICIKFPITSRPLLSNSHQLTHLIDNRLRIKQNHVVVSKDLKLVIRSRISEVANKFQCDNEIRH